MATFKDIIILQDGVSASLEDILKRTQKVNSATESLQKRMTNLGNKMKDIGKSLSLRITAPLVAAGTAAVKFASDMTETLGKTEVTFGEEAEAVKRWSRTSITQMGLASQSALDSAALFGDMATGMGMNRKEAAKMAMELTQLGADLASFKNISNDVAKTALKSIFTGETESLKNLGVVMTEVNLQEFARSQGIRKSISRMKEQEKIMLRYRYVLARTTNAQGDFARTNMNTANQMRMFTENLKQIGDQLGQILIPYVTKALQTINSWLVKFQQLDKGTQRIIVVIGLFAAAIPPLLIALGSVVTAMTAISAHPLVFTIMGIVTGFAMLYKWAKMIGEAFGRIVAYWDRISNARGITGKIGAFWNAMTGNTEELPQQQNRQVRNITSAQYTPIPQTTNNSMTNTFNVSGTVREEADIDRIGQTIVKKLTLASNNMGNYTPIR
nr:MAG TPA: minor tail protein [Caudoviricetes sp.]